MLKRIGLAILVIFIVVIMATFTANNTGMIDIDLAFARINTSIPLAFAVTFALGWLFGVITAFLLLSELVFQRFNTTPSGTVTSGLPYPFLNNLEFADRAVFYGSNFAVALVILLLYAGLAWIVRRRSLAPIAP